jgi:hypothetical protein
LDCLVVVGMRLISRFSLTGVHLYAYVGFLEISLILFHHGIIVNRVCIWLIWTTVSIGAINDEKPSALQWEGVRVMVMIIGIIGAAKGNNSF